MVTRNGARIDVDATASTAPGSTILRYAWDFDGDGRPDVESALPRATFAYDADGDYEIALGVQAADGQSALARQHVTIEGPPTQIATPGMIGGTVPATLALVADLYPVERRGVPLGVVSAVQELGSVIGPLFGAVVLALADWPTIFFINLAVGLVLAAALRATGGTSEARSRGRPDWIGLLLLALTLVFGVIVFVNCLTIAVVSTDLGSRSYTDSDRRA